MPKSRAMAKLCSKVYKRIQLGCLAMLGELWGMLW